MAVRWQARQVRDEATDQFRHLQNAESLNAYAHGADPQGLSRRQSTGSPAHARRRSTETSRAAEKMRFQVSKARRQRVEDAKEATRVNRERMKPRSKLLPAPKVSPLDRKKLPPIKRKKKKKGGGDGSDSEDEVEEELTGAQWAARERLRQQDNAEQPEAEMQEQRRKEAKARSAGRLKPSVMKEREEMENPVKLPKAWIEADKRRMRKLERAKLPLCKRWFPCCICCHGRSQVEPEENSKGKGKRRRRKQNDG